MKILFIILASLVIFSGCSITDLDYRLRNKKLKAALYKQEQARKAEQRAKKRARLRKKRRREARKAIPKAPKKHITLKKVEDDNYSAEYMYPKGKETTPAKEKTIPHETATPKETQIAPLAVASSTMTKDECISIIGQVKYDTYTQKFGNESATLKRCKMLKSMK